MKKLIFLITLFIVCAFSVAAQSACPIISVIGPNRITQTGEFMFFTVEVKGIEADKLSYNWNISQGKIANGQNTSTLSVATSLELAGQVITATVEIIGLPQNCDNKFSASGETSIICPPDSLKLDEFSTSPLYLEKERLEAFSAALSVDPFAQAYIIEQFNRETSPATIKKKIANIFSFMVKTMKISPERINISVVKDARNLTQYWIIPAGAEKPSLDLVEIEINGKDYQKKLDEMFPKAKSNSVRKRN